MTKKRSKARRKPTLEIIEVDSTISTRPDFTQPDVMYRPVEPNVLCKHCRALCNKIKSPEIMDEWISDFRVNKYKPRQGPANNKTLHHGKTFSQLLDSKQCHLCALLCTCITGETLDLLNTDHDAGTRQLWLNISGPTESVPSKWSMRLLFKGTLQNTSIEHFLVLEDRNRTCHDHNNLFYTDIQLHTYTGSEPHMNLAKQWLSQCETSHRLCREPTTRPYYLPSRLIETSSTSDSDLRLYAVQQTDEKLRYVALSHCWGKRDMLTLRSDNVDRLTQGFNLSELPPTFRDAVKIARKLETPYLWIDSLCILQDSISDWQNESPHMAAVFENAVCSIANLHGVDSYTGIFKERNPLEHLPCELTSYVRSGSSDYRMFASSWHIEWDFFSESHPSPIPARAPVLHSRAWVVQERVTATRTLNYSSRRMFWECRSIKPFYGLVENSRLEPSANFANTKKDRRSNEMKHLFNIFTDANLRPANILEDRKLFFGAWGSFLAAYTFGRLSFQSDRLMALKGVVTVIEQSLGLTCIFGLWKELLGFDIIWRRTGHPDFVPVKVCKSDSKRAPSWSWAKLDSTVDCHEVSQYCDALMYAVSFQYCPPETEALTQFQSNDPPHSLKISAPLREALFTELRFDKDRHYISLQDCSEVLGVWLDDPQLSSTLVGCSLHLLFICRRIKETKEPAYNTVEYNVGLLLERISETRSYRRIGLFLDSAGTLTVPWELSSVTIF